MDKLNCDEEYIGEPAVTFEEKLKEHVRAPSPIYDHANITGHQANVNNFSIVGREVHSMTRSIREAMCIRVSDPSLNNSIGKFQLLHNSMRSCSTPLPTTLSSTPTVASTHSGPHLLLPNRGQGLHRVCYTNSIGKYAPTPEGCQNPL